MSPASHRHDQDECCDRKELCNKPDLLARNAVVYLPATKTRLRRGFNGASRANGDRYNKNGQSRTRPR
jgi:hypothetical protein